MEYMLGQPITIVFPSQGLISGLTSFPDLRIFVDGVLTPETVTFRDLSNGLYSMSFNSNASGAYTVYIQGAIQTRFNVVTRDVYSFLRNIEDEAIGSWTWNKVTGVMSIIRQDSSILGTFKIIDTADSSSRERLG
jgi:hypothetical protein